MKDKLDSRTPMDFEFSKMYVGADADDVLEIFQEAQEELGNRFLIKIE
ncbi:hypothetical protein [Bacillus nakamurai]